MARSTKQEIIASFQKLLCVRTFDQITVKDIVEDCGVNRKTFYYYYQDIFAMIEDVFEQEIAQIRESHKSPEYSQRELMRDIARLMVEKRKMIMHLYHSDGCQRLMLYIRNENLDYLTQCIKQQSIGMSVSDKQISMLASIYDCVLYGMLLRWLEDDMKTDADDIIDNVSALMEGTMQLSLYNAERLTQKE